MTSFNRFGTESTNFFVTSVPIPCQTRSKDCFSSVSFFFPPRPTYARWDSNPEKMAAIWAVQLLFLSTNVLQYGPDALGRYFVAWPIPCLDLTFFIDSNKFFCKISRYTSPVMFPSIKTRFPTPHDEKQPQHFTFPPPYFKVGTVHFGSSSSFGVYHTITLPSDPNRLNLLSSVHNTLSQ